MSICYTQYGTFNSEIMEKVFYKSLLDQRQGEVALSFVRHQKDFAWYDKPTMTAQMKIWRKLAKQGRLKICKYNNLEFEYRGVTYYVLVVQDYDGAGEMVERGMDLMMFSVFHNMVDGYGYCYRTQKNRDDIYNYVMKDIDEPLE